MDVMSLIGQSATMKMARVWLERGSEIWKGKAMDVSTPLFIATERSDEVTLWSAPGRYVKRRKMHEDI